MKKIILLLLLFSFSFFLYGYILDYDSTEHYSGIYLQYNSLGSYKSCNSNINFILDGVGYQITLSGKSSEFNLECIKNNSIKKDFIYCSGSYSFSHVAYIFNDDFCKNKPGYVYNPNDNVWYPTSGSNSPICPSGKVWNSAQEKCIDDFNTQRDKCYQKCGGEDLTKSFTINSDGSSVCKCKLCSDIRDDFITYCNTQGGVLKDFSCQDDGEKITSLSPETQSPDICSISDNNQSDVNNSESNLSNDSNFTNSGSQNNNSDDGSNNQNNSDGDNGSSGSGNNDSNSSDNSVDCCSYYKSGHGQWTLINGCLEYTVPETGQECRIKDEGLKCYECNSDNSSDSNSSSINDIVTKIDETNSRLDKIDNTLKDIIDLKPSHSPDGNLSSDEISIFSGFTDTISNTKKALDDLTDSANKLKDLISNPKKFTLFNDNNTVTCPIVTNIYNKEISVDICKFIYPYKPILELFFTLIFSLYVVFYFFDVILKGSNR